MSRDIALMALTWALTWSLALTGRRNAYPLDLIAMVLTVPAWALLIYVLFGEVSP